MMGVGVLLRYATKTMGVLVVIVAIVVVHNAAANQKA
jgi:hypothetical protein